MWAAVIKIDKNSALESFKLAAKINYVISVSTLFLFFFPKACK